ncbi:tetratricopeptide repeat protein [bacterium]|nr:tetratricopeptide repeat protein [bacterium]
MYRNYQGRSTELDRAEALIRQWLQTDGDRSAPSLLLISGVAGIGKTSFKDELLRRLKQDCACVQVSYRCCQNHQWCGFLSACLHCLAQTGTGPAAQDWRNLCARAAERIGQDRAAELALLAHDYEQCQQQISSAEEPGTLADEEKDESDRIAGNPGLERLEQVAAAALELATAVSGMPLLLCLDDLHWLGSQESDFTACIAGLRLPLPPVIIGAIRSDQAEPQLARDYAGHETVHLKKIDSRAARSMIKEILADRAESVSSDIEDLADGLPLLIQQAAQLEREQPGNLGLQREGLSKLEQILLQRIDALGDELRQLVWLLAVAGPDLLEQVVLRLHWRRLNAAGSQAPRLYELPQQIQQLNLKHDEVRAAVLRSIPPAQAQDMELLVANELQRELRHGQLGELDTLRALCTHLRRAGENNQRHRRLCQLMLLQLRRGRDEDYAALELEARESAEGVSPWLLRVQAAYMLKAGETESARAILQLALEHSSGTDRADIRGRIQGDLGILAHQVEDFEQALDYYTQSIGSLEVAGNQRSIGITHGNIGTILHRLGKLTDARECYEKSLSIALAHGDSMSSASTLGYLGNLYLDLGNLALAISSLQDALRLYTDLNDMSGMANSMSDLGNAYREAGQLELAESYYRDSLDVLTRLGYDSGRALAIYNLGRMYKVDGRLEQALAALQSALEIEGSNDYQGAAAAIYQAELGDALTLSGDAASALPLLESSYQSLRDSPLQFFFGACTCYLACCCIELGLIDRAEDLLSEAESLFKQLGTREDLDFYPELKRLRARLAGGSEAQGI